MEHKNVSSAPEITEEMPKDSVPEEKSHDFQTSQNMQSLLDLASRSLEEAASLPSDDLDLDADGRPERRGRKTDQRERDEVQREQRLLAEVKVLERLDVAFSSIAERFLRRETVAALDQEFNRQNEADESPQKRHFSHNVLAEVWEHHMDRGLMVFYKVPSVRQYFEDHQHEHEVDWADLFFDLTYVAAAYQLGEMLKADVSWRGVYYFTSMSICMIDVWRFKTLHDSTFEATDFVHKVVDVLYVCTVASASIFIQPLKEMEALGSGFSLGLSISLAANTAILGLEKLEIFFRSKSNAAVKYCWGELLMEIVPRCICFVAASVFSDLGHGSNHQTNAKNYLGKHHVFFYVAILFWGSHVLAVILPLILYILHWLPKPKIPFHYQHIAHRYGEWIMLILGESVLSIIFQANPDVGRYYLAFFTSLLIVQMLQLVHFSSEEFDPRAHALSRSQVAGYAWLELMSAYSISLISLGVGLKTQLDSVVCEDPDTPNVTSDGSVYFCPYVPRKYTTLLCGAFVAQYIFSQVSIPLHEGLKIYFRHFFDFSQHTAYVVVGIKVITVGAVVALGCYPGDLRSFEILLVVASVMLIQSLVQTQENMIVYVRRDEERSRKMSKTSILRRFGRPLKGRKRKSK